jgi:hypothetical protein
VLVDPTTLVDGASITLPLSGERLDATTIAARPEFAEPLMAAVQALENAAAAYRVRRDELQRR